MMSDDRYRDTNMLTLSNVRVDHAIRTAHRHEFKGARDGRRSGRRIRVALLAGRFARDVVRNFSIVSFSVASVATTERAMLMSEATT